MGTLVVAGRPKLFFVERQGARRQCQPSDQFFLHPARIAWPSCTMAPLVLHNVPDEELYTGKDGVTRPFAVIGATDEWVQPGEREEERKRAKQAADVDVVGGGEQATIDTTAATGTDEPGLVWTGASATASRNGRTVERAKGTAGGQGEDDVDDDDGGRRGV